MTAALCLSLVGCGLLPDKDPEDMPENWPEEKLYFAGKDRLESGSCNGAIDYYEKLQARYPFGAYAPQAQLELAYCHYKADETPKAIASVDRFMKLNPTHPHMDYAFYLRGLINFNNGTPVLPCRRSTTCRNSSSASPTAAMWPMRSCACATCATSSPSTR